MKKLLFILIFFTACTDLGTQVDPDYTTIRVTGYFENYQQIYAINPEFIVTSADTVMPDTIKISGINLRGYTLPAPRVRLGITLIENSIYNIRYVVRQDIELDVINIPVVEMELLELEYPFAYTDKGRYRYDTMILARQEAPDIEVGDMFRATLQDSTITSLDR